VCRKEKESRENTEPAGRTAFAANARDPIRTLPMPNALFLKKVRRVMLFMSFNDALRDTLFECFGA